jgi:hypothetical protein
MRIRVSPIVEGHGEVQALRVLLDRIVDALAPGRSIDVLRPIRRPRGTLVKTDGARRAAALARLKLGRAEEGRRVVLLLIDSDGECPAEVGPRLAGYLKEEAGDCEVIVAIAHLEYETWLAGSAGTMTDLLDLSARERLPARPEEERVGKKWIETRFREGRYSEAVDQARLTARLDVAGCRARCPSFDRLCRRLAEVLGAAGE